MPAFLLSGGWFVGSGRSVARVGCLPAGSIAPSMARLTERRPSMVCSGNTPPGRRTGALNLRQGTPPDVPFARLLIARVYPMGYDSPHGDDRTDRDVRPVVASPSRFPGETADCTAPGSRTRRFQGHPAPRYPACAADGQVVDGVSSMTTRKIAAAPAALEALGVQPFDLADYLDSDEAITEYLSQVLADGDADELLRALGHIAKAKGMTRVARVAGLGRESLYKTLAPGAKPRFDTIQRILAALGLRLSVEADKPRSAA